MTISKRITKALDYATRMHIGQIRKISGLPYITHPKRVAKLVWAAEEDEDLIIASLLHDVVEDCYNHERTQAYLLEDINKIFGSVIEDLIIDLTNVYTKEFYPNLNRKERKKLELERICDISQKAKLIKCADRIDNVLDFNINGGMPDYYISESRKLFETALEGQTGSPYLEMILYGLLQ